MKKSLVLIIAGVLLLGAGVGGGYLLAGRLGGSRVGGPNGGPFAQLTSAERAKLQTMSASERQAFFKEKGITMPTGGPGGGFDGGPSGATGMRGARGGGLLEGTITSVDAEKAKLTLTGGGSATVYLDSSTVIAAEQGATATLTNGAKVLVSAQPEADGVSAAKAVIVRK